MTADRMTRSGRRDYYSGPGRLQVAAGPPDDALETPRYKSVRLVSKKAGVEFRSDLIDDDGEGRLDSLIEDIPVSPRDLYRNDPLPFQKRQAGWDMQGLSGAGQFETHFSGGGDPGDDDEMRFMPQDEKDLYLLRQRRLIQLYKKRLVRRAFQHWREVTENSFVREVHIEVRRLAIFKKYLQRRLMRWAWDRWRNGIDHGNMKTAIVFHSCVVMFRALRAWVDWKEQIDELRRIMALADYARLWRAWKRILVWWAGILEERERARRERLAERMRRMLLKRAAFATWARHVADSKQRCHLVSESAVLSRLHHFFAAWMGYVSGYAQGRTGAAEGAWPRTESRLLSIKKLLATEGSSRRRLALVANMKAAAIWEHMAKAFRAWAGAALLGGLTHPDQRIPFRAEFANAELTLGPEASWFPVVRLVRLLHIQWALLTGEEAWHQGFHDGHLLWQAMQVWKRWVADVKRKRQEDLERFWQKWEVACRWHASRLAWKAYHGWVRIVIAERLTTNLYEQIRLQMFLAFHIWREQFCVSRLSIKKANRALRRRYALIMQAFFNTWRRIVERTRIGRHMTKLIQDVEDAARAAQEDNDRMRSTLEGMLNNLAESEEEARQELLIAKQLYAEQTRKAETLESLLEKAKRDAEAQRQREVEAREEARSAQEQARRLAQAAEAERGCFDNLVSKIQHVSDENRNRREKLQSMLDGGEATNTTARQHVQELISLSSGQDEREFCLCRRRREGAPAAKPPKPPSPKPRKPLPAPAAPILRRKQPAPVPRRAPSPVIAAPKRQEEPLPRPEHTERGALSDYPVDLWQGRDPSLCPGRQERPLPRPELTERASLSYCKVDLWNP